MADENSAAYKAGRAIRELGGSLKGAVSAELKKRNEKRAKEGAAYQAGYGKAKLRALKKKGAQDAHREVFQRSGPQSFFFGGGSPPQQNAPKKAQRRYNPITGRFE